MGGTERCLQEGQRTMKCLASSRVTTFRPRGERGDPRGERGWAEESAAVPFNNFDLCLGREEEEEEKELEWEECGTEEWEEEGPRLMRNRAKYWRR